MRGARAIPLLLLLLAGARPAQADERLHYRWSLDGFIGLIASLFMPTDGDGILSFEEIAPGIARGVLEVTSPESKSGEFFRYGAEWQRSDGRTLRAWSDSFWRGEKKSKKSEVGDAGVIDIVSGIDLLRRHPPVSQQRLEIWSDGKRYPVIVLPRGPANKHVAGRDVATRHLSIRGVAVPDRNLWKGELDLWLAEDAAATPVEILVSRSGARVRLTLVEYPAGPRPLTATEPEGSP
jgi:hypothetical protein